MIEQFSLKADFSADVKGNDELVNSESVSELHEDVMFQTSEIFQNPFTQAIDECDVVLVNELQNT